MSCDIPRCFSAESAISARPERAADGRRFMFSEEGGVGTCSSSLRLARSSSGSRRAFRDGFFAAFLAGFAVGLAVAARRAVARLAPFFPAARCRLGRLTDRSGLLFFLGLPAMRRLPFRP